MRQLCGPEITRTRKKLLEFAQVPKGAVTMWRDVDRSQGWVVSPRSGRSRRDVSLPGGTYDPHATLERRFASRRSRDLLRRRRRPGRRDGGAEIASSNQCLKHVL